ncbi:MarR family transcriptional regulator [Ornithinimicrobium sp. LYQ103]|uniref:MarR family transcriptional regulator n=1 Tax=Ornithinimicrobium sp. LYQ103 TaxID=3378796 RepID=UPI003851894F
MTASAARSISTDPVSLWGHVIEGFQGTNRHLHRTIAQEFSLTAAESEAVLRLGRSPEHRLPMTELAGQVAFSTGGVSKVADRLARRSLARRVANEEDRRVIFLQLTPEGVEVAGRLRARVHEVVQATFVDVLGAERALAVAEAMAVLAEARRD